MRVLLACLLLACGACSQTSTTHPSTSLESVLETWRESVELDLPSELLRDEKRLLEEHPALRTSGEALDLRVRARVINGDWSAANEILEDTQLDGSEEKYAKLARARVALLSDDFDKVRSLLLSPKGPEVIAECSDLPDAWLILARAHARDGNDADAAFLYHEFIRRDALHPESPSAWHFLAGHASRTQQAAAAKQYGIAARQATEWQSYYRARRIQVRENPQATLPRIGLVILWMQAGRPEAAKEELERIFALDPNHCEAFGHLAEAERKLENFDAAKAAYDRALECAPERAGLRFNRAYLAGLQGRSADARNDYEWIVASEHVSDPRFQTAHLELARIALAAGDSKRADRHYELYVELGGEQPLAE